jgi:hypothetical protein
MGLTEILANPLNLLIIVGAWAVVKTLTMAIPELADRPWFARLLPVLPLALTSGFVWIPGATEAAGVGERIMLGLVLGFFVGHAHKIIGQTALGRDRRIP